jgi:hypothetical protein
MTTQLHAGATLAAFIRSATTSVEGTTSGSFDSTYVANSISVDNGINSDFNSNYLSTPVFTTVTTYCFRGDFYNSATGTNSNPWVAFYNSSGTRVAHLIMNASQQVAFAFWNGTTYTTSSFVTRPVWSTRGTLVVKITCGASGTYDVLWNGASILSGSITSASCNNIAQTRVYNGCYNNMGYWSQIMGADYDISSSHYSTLAINGNSASNTGQSSGVYTDVNESPLDDATMINISTSGNKAGVTHAALTLPSGYAISAAIINARGRVAGSITDGKLGWRYGGTNYSSAGKSYTSSFEPRSLISTTNPGTSTAWDQTSYNAAELYLEAA